MRIIRRLHRAGNAAFIEQPAVAPVVRPPVAEAMEERMLFASFLVTTTANSGTGSLRDAMQKANGNGSVADVIQFKIGTGLKTITPLSSLPHLTGPTTIDGSTQGGYTGKPLIEIRGDRAGSASSGLVLRGGSGTVKGLVINRFGGCGVMLLSKGGNTVKNCYIGTDASGNAAAGNKQKGIVVQSPGNTLGGTGSTDRLVISGNGQSGVQFYTSAASGNKMLGCYVGTNAAGTFAVRNVATGVSVYQAANNTIGGTTSGARNVISGNGQNGIVVLGTGAKYNKILGNYVGTNAAGTARLGNAHYGIEISQPYNTVGGTTSGARNVVSGNKYAGVVLWLASGSNNKIQGNYIGTDYTGKVDLGNYMRGIDVSNGSSNNLIGGATAAERNVISGNEQDGVRVYQGTGNRIQGNYIGIGSDGLKPMGNGGDGCRLVQTSFCTVQSNKIGYNAGYAVHNGTSTGTKVTSNTLVSDVLFGVKQT